MSLQKTLLALALGSAMALPAAAQTITQTYVCERGVTVPAVYVNGADITSVVVLYVEGRMITLEQAVSGSGARYAWPSDGSGYEWWEHQGEATLNWLDGETDQSTPLLEHCKPQS